MYDFSLLSICMMAFTGVFVLLAILAAVMRLILVVFPYRESDMRKTVPARAAPSASGALDSGIVAAITTIVAAAYPGAKISNIEEIK